MKIGEKTVHLPVEIGCCLFAVVLMMGFHGLGKTISGQGELGLVPLLIGAIGVGFGFWVWYQADRLVEERTRAAAVPLIVAMCTLIGLYVGVLFRGALLNMGVNQMSGNIIWLAVISLGVALGLRIRFLLLKG